MKSSKKKILYEKDTNQNLKKNFFKTSATSQKKLPSNIIQDLNKEGVQEYFYEKELGKHSS